VRQLLGDGADDLDVDGAGQPLQLAQRVLDGPEVVRLVEVDSEQEGPLLGALGGVRALGGRRGVVRGGVLERGDGRVGLAALVAGQGRTLG
jgi:hypothetical protein